MHKTHLQRLWALLMVLLMLAGSASAAVNAGETISSDSKWINSTIEGAVDEQTQVSLKDDFHTAVNLEWLLTDEDGDGPFSEAEALLYERKLEIVLGRAQIDPANADAIGLSSEWLAHDLKLVQTFSSLSGEWEYRNANGVEAARPFLEAVEGIRTMEEMSAYLVNEDGMNLTGMSLVTLDVQPDEKTGTVYQPCIKPNSHFTLSKQEQYAYITAEGFVYRNLTDASVKYLLGRLGYTDAQIMELLQKCYRFEIRLAQHIVSTDEQQTVNYVTSAETLTLEQLTQLAGSYPISRLLDQYGMGGQDGYQVFEKRYLKALGGLYQEQYLEEMKAMCMVHTVRALLPLLDEEAYDMAERLEKEAKALPREEEEPIGQNEKEPVDRKKDIAAFVFDNYLQKYLPGPMDQIYVAAYCTPELKAEVRALIDAIIADYRKMILDVEWLSESARNATVEKLENMVIRCVYPDRFVDYSGLTLQGCRDNQGGTLPMAVAAINQFQQHRRLSVAGQPVERGSWDMSAPFMSTTVCNAYYAPLENSINILAGILTEIMYAPEMSYEEKLARVGSVIGHEITHAFDNNGYRYDKDGRLNPWWSTRDVEAFDLRASKLIKYYNTITPYPGAFFYVGEQVAGEAIADMGGVKCMLSIAKQTPGFDYATFFRAYAQQWRERHDLETEKWYAQSDAHPLGFLRTNVTVMQFEEFYETFDIQPGDGMYMAPEDRISVW